MSVSIDCPFLIVPSLTSFCCACQQEKDVRDGTIRNGQSRDTDIDIHKNKTLQMWQSGMDNLETLTLTYTEKKTLDVSRVSIPDCPIPNVFCLCMSISVSLDCPFMIVLSLTSFFLCMAHYKDIREVTFRNGQSRETDIDIHKKKTLEIGQSGMDNLETLTLTYTISNVCFLCMSMSVSLDCPFLIVPSLASCSCVCQCQCL
jgi:hypothetical protein